VQRLLRHLRRRYLRRAVQQMALRQLPPFQQLREQYRRWRCGSCRPSSSSASSRLHSQASCRMRSRFHSQASCDRMLHVWPTNLHTCSMRRCRLCAAGSISSSGNTLTIPFVSLLLASLLLSCRHC